jgi:hypothetical protein
VPTETARAIIGCIFAGGAVFVGTIAVLLDKSNVPLVMGILSTLASSVAASYFTAKAMRER